MSGAKFGSVSDLRQYYADFYGTPNGVSVPASKGLRPVGPAPARAFPVTPYTPPPRVVDITPRVAAPSTPVNVLPTGTVPPKLPGSGAVIPAERGFGLRGNGTFTQAQRPIELTDALPLENPPAVRTTTSPIGVTERGFRLGAGSDYVNTTARRVAPAATPKAPLQIEYGYNPPKGFTGPVAPAEGMGDFVPPSMKGTSAAGRLGLRGALRTAGRVALGPEALAVQALSVPAAMQSAATANSNGAVSGLRRSAPSWGPGPGRSFTTNAISYTDPITGKPVAVTQAKDQSMTAGLRSIAPAAAPQADWLNSDARRKMIKYTAGANLPDAVAPAPVTPVMDDPNGFAIVDGRRINYADIGLRGKDAAYDASKGFSFAVAPSVPVTGVAPVAGGLRTAADYVGNVNPTTAEGAMVALRMAGALAQQDNARVISAQDHDLENQKLGLEQDKIGLGLRRLQMEEPYYAAHAKSLTSAATKDEALAAAAGDKNAIALERQQMINEQRQKEADLKAQLPEMKADADYASQIALQTGLPPSTVMKGLRKGFTTVKKPTKHWFKADEPGGLADSTGRVFTPQEASVPEGYTHAGYSKDGAPVYRDQQGKLYTM